MAALALMHLIALHDSAGSGNPLGVSGNYDRLPFAPYFIFKDLITIFIFILVLSLFVFFMPNLLGDSENYVMANPMQTPPAIVPEWYLLPFYAILRSIPNKLLGVIAMFSAILILLAMPFTDLSRFRGTQFRPLSKAAFFIFLGNFLILMQLGAKHVESPFIEFGQISTVIYFSYFLIIVPIISLLENSLIELASEKKEHEFDFNDKFKADNNIIISNSSVLTSPISTLKFATLFFLTSFAGAVSYVFLNLNKKFDHCDAPRPWGVYFQDSASPQMEGLVELHDNILFYLVIILFAVGWILVSIAKTYTNLESPVSHKNVSHGTLIELIWTITPALILIFIAFPSFKLLYLMDEVSDPSMAVLAEGSFFLFFLFIKKMNGGPKSYILNKIENTYKYRKTSTKTSLNTCRSTVLFIGQKNNILPLSYSNKLNINMFHTKIKAINRIGPHNEDVISVIIGSLLGDSYANRRHIDGVRICYRQSEQHKEYLLWLYGFFYSRGYCSNLKPRQFTRKLKHNGVTKTFSGYEFNTYSFRNFNWLHKMFYKKGMKTVNVNIEKYLTPLALAIWIMDDGMLAKPGVRIASNSFNLKEIELLVKILNDKFNLHCTIQYLKSINKYSIYIKALSIPHLIKIILPYTHKSMYYKLGLQDNINQE